MPPTKPKVPETQGSYQYFMRPEPSDNLGPIKLEDDVIFGRRVKTRMVRIGMVRNEAEGRKKSVKVFLEPYPHVRIDKAKPLQGWYKSANEPNAVRPRPCYSEAILTEPYGGYCPVGCLGCYINSGMRGYRGTGLVTVPLDYGQQVVDQLSRMYRGAAGYFTSFHDPFNVLEAVYHNTQRAAEAFVEQGLPIFFLSRLKYPEWAIDLLKRNPYSYAQRSINTPSLADWKILSPGALSLDEQIVEVAYLHKRGIYVSIQVNPIIPGVTSISQIVELLGLLAEAGANHVIVKFIEAGYSWAPTMVRRMVNRFGARGEAFGALFTQNIGGEKCVDEAYRMKAHKIFAAEAKRVGLTYSVCYEYRYERDAAGKILGKTGVSIGPEVTTSAQCHGQRVPVYMRRSLDEKFTAVEECPATGCLYCASKNGDKPRCGDALMGEAPALRLADYHKPMVKE